MNEINRIYFRFSNFQSRVQVSSRLARLQNVFLFASSLDFTSSTIVFPSSDLSTFIHRHQDTISLGTIQGGPPTSSTYLSFQLDPFVTSLCSPLRSIRIVSSQKQLLHFLPTFLASQLHHNRSSLSDHYFLPHSCCYPHKPSNYILSLFRLLRTHVQTQSILHSRHRPRSRNARSS